MQDCREQYKMIPGNLYNSIVDDYVRHHYQMSSMQLKAGMCKYDLVGEIDCKKIA